MPQLNPGLGLFVINGTDEDDPNLTGTLAADWIRGFDGNDVIKADGGNDVVQGGDGDDTLYGGPGSDEVDGGAGSDLIVHDPSRTDGTFDTDTYDGGAGVDTLRLDLTSDDFSNPVEWEHAWDDIVAYSMFYPTTLNAAGVATAQPFTFDSLNLTVRRFEKFEVYVDGTQVIFSDSDPDGAPVLIDFSDSTTDEYVVVVGGGDTAITTGSGDDTIITGDGSDVILAGDGDNFVYPGDGDDSVFFGAGTTTIIAGQGGGDDFFAPYLFPPFGESRVFYGSVATPIFVDLSRVDREDTPLSGGGTVGDLLEAQFFAEIDFDPNYPRDFPVGIATGAEIGTDVFAGVGSDIYSGVNEVVGGSAADEMWGMRGPNVTVESSLYGFFNDTGNDVLHGGHGFGNSANVTNLLVGDVKTQRIDRPDGDPDIIHGGWNLAGGGTVMNIAFGDVENEMSTGVGAGDEFFGGDTYGNGLVRNTFYGDAFTLSGDATGGDEFRLSGMHGGSNLFGAVNGGLATGDGRVENIMYGDAAFMTGESTGGQDDLFGGHNYGTGDVAHNLGGVLNVLVGEAAVMSGNSEGVKDILVGGDNFGPGDPFGVITTVTNILVGDGQTMTDNARGADFDELYGGNNADAGGIVENFLYGDARDMNNNLAGDANPMGGDDFLFGGDSAGSGNPFGQPDLTNWLYGDAETMRAGVGGNDELTGGDGTTTVSTGGYNVVNWLYGDAEEMFSGTGSGNDTLISGSFATDHMYGDAAFMFQGGVTTGMDTFVFGANWGNDFIYDFEDDFDGIEFRDVIASVGELGHMDGQGDGNDLVINFSGNSILVHNITWADIMDDIDIVMTV